MSSLAGIGLQNSSFAVTTMEPPSTCGLLVASLLNFWVGSPSFLKMLVFDPSKRISVTEALQHPYMSPLYDPRCDPPAQVPINLDIDEDLGEEMIREMMWTEILHYHPEAATTNLEVNM
ncbi:Mitogen-activated protein kinaseNTF3 [Sesamum angolense]|uniref:Mitogen-activated protein kinaseNTF3 n=1 Tax=Sesamum angolense TaxID=2727404 RepID=A0AAE2BJB2_9LAMI|nr:Mitogen-activated protein kinaseNTF3 [Sesamum angolense]